ncbi:MAG: hypothetical protein ACD_81C00190G0005 [uncultured bacterium]|uniref:Methyltransferase type 11 n=1 Tax=Candidatus Wolfebacteria bacterium GW2011_GWC2_39_22 TaxID=1619013 RepID=A0A0G0NIH5_9BACT|nr:MAG: hypothetical protein ACD_81C00190G0005 [uncultured bacterium]KKR12601.1 MAG: hypothetical protein UT41_C0001G0145 [Candidatus Wolfebacteria bacterium GW2011_GWC2_39_22]HBI25802.1 hypothetical protein [Candidatus Wolfebacteria bacterium]
MNIHGIKNILKIIGFIFIKPNDDALIRKIKKDAAHTDRSFWYGLRKYVVDAIYCHASPGTFETILLELDKIGGKENKRVLNLGGGNGQVSRIIEQLGFTVVNVDIELDKEDEKNIRFDLNSDNRLTVPPHSFDVVICQEIIEHIENPWKLLRFAKLYLKPSGILFLTTPNIQSRLSKVLFFVKGYFKWFEPRSLSFHINPLPVWEVELIANKAGLTLTDCKGSGEYYFGRNKKRKRSVVLQKNETLIFIYQA